MRRGREDDPASSRLEWGDDGPRPAFDFMIRTMEPRVNGSPTEVPWMIALTPPAADVRLFLLSRPRVGRMAKIGQGGVPRWAAKKTS